MGAKSATRIVGHALEQRDVLGERRGGQQQRVAVRRRARRDLRADVAAGARLVLDHDRLAPALLDLFAQHAREDVGPGPRRERHDDRDGAARLLREGAAGCEGGRSDRGQQ